MSTDSWSHTLRLPVFHLPARAGLARREPETLARWASRDLLAEQARDPDRPEAFVLHDGPPYANGPVHLGHVLNKALKDFVVRSQALEGRRVPLVLGWDCHGLPVERAVLEAEPPLADADPLELRAACRAWALRWQAHQHERFRRLLALTGGEVYRTLDPAYEAAVLEVLADLVDQGLVYRALRPVRWSLGNATALAEAELEFDERVDPALWVDFETELDGVALTAWTTTPWTLPANLALAVDPDATYALTRADRQRVVALEAVPRLAEALGADVQVVRTMPGRELLGLRYEPLLTAVPGAFRVVAGAHVVAGEGSGVVHTAPGHGPEDFVVGEAEGLDPYCPLGADGRLDDTVPERLRGLTPEAADPVVVMMLREAGALAAAGEVAHSVALDWRGGARVVYRATPQWFVALDRPTRHGPTLRQAALRALAEVEFVPRSGRRRLEAMLRARPDWCVSRQRAWGLPLPALYEGDGTALLTGESVRAVARVVRREGADAWYRRTSAELVGRDGLEKGTDVLDVWFESGASWRAVLGSGADLYLEGSDQHRGWFQASLLLAVATTGRAPYRTVVTHGFVVDREGRKLSKSRGNAPDVDELFEAHGAEVLRWWAATSRYEADVKVDEALFGAASKEFRKVRETLRFALGNVADLPDRSGPPPGPTTPEAWLLRELDGLVVEVREAYASFAFAVAARALHRFCAETLSARYLEAAKDRLYCDPPDSGRRRRAQRALADVVDVLARLLAPLLPHTADEVWRALHGCAGDPVATVHAARFPEARGLPVDPAWDDAVAVRHAAAVALGPVDPLDHGLVLPRALAALDPQDLADWCGVSRVSFGEGLEVVDLRDEPRCERSRRRTADVRLREGGAWLSDRDAAVVGQVQVALQSR